MELTPKQQKKIQNIAEVVDKGNIAIAKMIFELEDKIDEQVPNFEEITKRISVKIKGKDGDKGEKGDKGERGETGRSIQGIKGDKGEKGERGEKGEKGDRGTDGVNPSISDITELVVETVTPLIPTIEDIKNNIPVIGERVRDSLELLQEEDRLDASAIKGLDKFVRTDSPSYVGTTGIKELVAGTNITIDNTNMHYPVISATGGGGVSDGDKGDITVSGSGATWTIDNDTIGLDELSATGTPSASTFLRGDNTWSTPAGAGTVTSVTSANADATVANTTTTPVITIVSAPKLTTARTIAGVSFDGTANISLNNNAITNGAGYITASALSSYQPLDADLTTIAGLTATTDNFIQSKAGAWASRTVAQVKTDLGLTGTNSGDQTITLTGDVTGTGTGSFATTIASGAVDIAMLSATGTPSASTYLRGDNTWATVGGSGTVTSVSQTVPTGLTITGSPVTTTGTLAIGLDTGYVIPLQSVIDAKAPLASPTFTGTVTTPALNITGADNGTAPLLNITGGFQSGGGRFPFYFKDNGGVDRLIIGMSDDANNDVVFNKTSSASSAFKWVHSSIITNVLASLDQDGDFNATGNITGFNLSGTNTGDNAVNSLYSGLVTNATHTGDATGATALTVVAINGTNMAGLATGILKNTTGTGVPSIATGADLPVMTATVGGAVPTPPNNTTTFLRGDGTFATPAGGGTVTSASVVSANGFAGTVATATTTPAITLTTSITGMLKGNGTAISAGTAGTDYSAGTSALATGILKSTTTTGALTIAVAGDFPTLNQSTTGSAATLTTPRAIYGNNFDGSAALTQVIASTYGGTGNGFTKFTGPTTAEKTFTLPDASGTIVTKATNLLSKSITIESPTATEDISMFFTSEAITISKITFVITGSTSVTTTIRQGTDRSAAGTEVVTGGTVANSTTTGNVVTSFNDATVPANSFIWLETTALSGTPTSLNVTIFYTID